MGGQAGSEDTGITSGLRQQYQVGRLVTDESSPYANYPYGVSENSYVNPNLMGVGAAANMYGLLNGVVDKAAPDKNFVPKLNVEGEAEPVSMEDKLARIMKQYEVTPEQDLNAVISGLGQFGGSYTLGEALQKAAQTRNQIIEPKLQRAQDIKAKLDLLPIEQAYKERLQMLKNKDKTFALSDKITKLKEGMNRLYEIEDKLKDPTTSLDDKKKLLREKSIIEGTVETILPKSDPILEGFLKSDLGAKLFKSEIAAIKSERGIKDDEKVTHDMYIEAIKRVREKLSKVSSTKDKAMKKGGRVKMEEGGIPERYTTDDESDTESNTDTAEQGTDLNLTDLASQQQNQMPQSKMQQIAANQVQPLSYQELRARLPKEISDEVVNLISKSQQALVDFANITTQKDAVDFNAKYGVNLVLPQV
jgi:hypothetical protein